MTVFCLNRKALPSLATTIGILLFVSGCNPSDQNETQIAWQQRITALRQAQQAYKSGHIDSAIRIWRQLSEQDDPAAQFSIGLMYANGTGVRQSDADAARWYRKAADLGLAQAQFNLANMYSGGIGVPQDFVASIWWYRKAAEQGFVDAQLNLGLRYTAGLGVTQDYIQAHKWCNLAAAGAHDAEVRSAAVRCRRDVAAEMTADKVAEAQRLASEWRPIRGAKISAYVEMVSKFNSTPKAAPTTFATPALPEEISEEEYQASLRGLPPTLKEAASAAATAPTLPEEISEEEYQASLLPKQ